MKVAKWKVLGIAGVLTLGYVVTSDAAQIKVDDETWANFGLNMKIFYRNLDKAGNATVGNWRRNVFDVNNAKIYFAGQVNKLFQFYGEFDQEKSAPLSEAGINLAFAKEFQISAGLIRKPFTRANLTSGYAYLIPTGPSYSASVSGNVTNILTDQFVDVGIMIRGDLAGGMLTYRIGAYNNNDTAKKYNRLEWAARVEFQPLMLGFKPESAATITSKINDTYLGNKDIFTIGLGYRSYKNTNATSAPYSNTTTDGWTIDATFEKKYGNLVPNLQIGYVAMSDTHRDNGTNPKWRDSEAWYVQGQLLFDQVVGIGKPAIAIRFETTENDKKHYYSSSGYKDTKLDRLGVAFNYYIKGQAARISLGFDNLKYKDGSRDYLKSQGYKTSFTDWYLYLQSTF